MLEPMSLSRLTIVWLCARSSDLPLDFDVGSITLHDDAVEDLVYHAFLVALHSLKSEIVKIRQRHNEFITPNFDPWAER